jgi:hypothetical protein
MISEQIAKLSSPIARALLSGLVEDMQECIFVPNHLVEPQFRTGETDKDEYVFENGRQYGQSLSSLEKRAAIKQKEESVLTYQQEKENRIFNYVNQPRDEEIQFLEDEDRLYRAQVAFCKLALPADTFED